MINEPFNLQEFITGKPVRTKDGKSVQFVALLPKEAPARLLVAIKSISRTPPPIPVKKDAKQKSFEDLGRMDNYYLNGQWLPDVQSTVDLVMDSLF